MIPHRWRAKRSLKFMPKRRSDADSRIFFDELVSLTASRLRATGAIRMEDRQGVIAFAHEDHGGDRKCIGIAHTKFPNGGSWSYFICPRCGGRRKKLWLVDDAPRCLSCCWGAILLLTFPWLQRQATFRLAMISIRSGLKQRASQRCRNTLLSDPWCGGRGKFFLAEPQPPPPCRVPGGGGPVFCLISLVPHREDSDAAWRRPSTTTISVAQRPAPPFVSQ
jgi:hypothetical protein